MRTFENLVGAIVYIPLALIIFMTIGIYQLYMFGKYCVYTFINKEIKY